MKYHYSDHIPFYQKLNYSCPKDYKDGEGQGSCKGYVPGNQNYENDKKRKAEKQKGVDERRGKRAERLLTKSEKLQISNLKTVMDKVKAELASGKVSKQTYKELRLAVKEVKDIKLIRVEKPTIEKEPINESNTKEEDPSKFKERKIIQSASNRLNLVMVSAEVKGSGQRADGYKPPVYDSSTQYNKIPAIIIGENNPGYVYQAKRETGAEKGYITFRTFTPISLNDIKPYADEVDTILEKENLPPLSKLEIYTEQYPGGSASYDPRNQTIQLGQEIFEKKYYNERVSDNERYQKQNGVAYSVIGYTDNQQDAIRVNLLHELAHHEMATYMQRNNKQIRNNRITDGDDEWDSIIQKVSSKWDAPSKYSQATSGEMYAECVALYTMNMKEKLHPDIVDYIEKVKSYNRSWKG